MKPLIDGDILRYEIGFGAETGWRAITGDSDNNDFEQYLNKVESIPPFDYVERLLNDRIEYICERVGATEPPTIYMSRGRCFRHDIATKKPYKGTRRDNKPWHYNNLTIYLTDVLGAIYAPDSLEADDALAIEHVSSNGTTVLCTRDKDLRQVPGMFYSWELGKQPEFGPIQISQAGSIQLSEDRKKIVGTGLAFFYSQLLTGDATDNIPGLPGCGPVKAYKILGDWDEPNMVNVLDYAYEDYYRGKWQEEMLEQGRLLWMTRKLYPSGKPVLWELGMGQ